MNIAEQQYFSFSVMYYYSWMLTA